MRIQIDRAAMQYLRGLRETGRPLWDAIEGLRMNPLPKDVRVVEERANRYELFSAGHWIVYKVEKNGETVVTILLVEAN